MLQILPSLVLRNTALFLPSILCQLNLHKHHITLATAINRLNKPMCTSPVDGQAEGRARRMGVPLLYVHTGSDVTAVHSVKYWSCTGNVHHTVFARLHQVHNTTQKAHSHVVKASYNLKTHNSTFRRVMIIILKAARTFNP